ncbi:hypothetical protein BGX31_006229 [Mortierella sp. GBA43]|nr:hypothetical protein BGX31_006229 [Mortierella sp. GBA43]
MGGSDKKRKRSKTDESVKAIQNKSLSDVSSLGKHGLSERPDNDLESNDTTKKAKKSKKDKRDKEESLKNEEKQEKKDVNLRRTDADEDTEMDLDAEEKSKVKKRKKEKKEKKDKKDKEERKGKKEKNTKNERSMSLSLDDDASANSVEAFNLISSTHSETEGMDVDVAQVTAAATVKQDVVNSVAKWLDQAREVKMKEKRKEKKKNEGSNITTSTSTVSAISTSKSDDAGVPIKQTGLQADTSALSKKERKMLKTKQKLLNRKSEGDGEPEFTIQNGHDRLTLKDLRDLVVFILTETPSLPWIQVRNKFKVEKVLLLYVSGLDPQLFHLNLRTPDAHKPVSWIDRAEKEGGAVAEFEHLRHWFQEVNVAMATGDKFRIFSPTNTLLNVPLSNMEKAKRETEKKSQPAAKKKPESYLMTVEELREYHFPIPRYMDTKDETSKLPKGWIETPKLKKTTLTPPPKTMIALDCEMCRTENGSELTRVSLIDHNGKNIFDELVMPESPILDYLTQYSGMTAERLEGVTTRLEDVQKKLRQIINYNTILVGHSLENDMNVLKLAHPFIIDTSLVYHHTRGPPYRPGLKWLAQKWLQRQIQANVERGHDSAEDALACMDLIKLKLTRPPGFGEYVQDQESLFSRLHRFNVPRTSALIDMDAFAGQSATRTIKTQSDKEVVAAIPEAIRTHNFVWARLRDIELNYGKAPEHLVSSGESQQRGMDTGRAGKISSADKVQASEEEIRKGIRSIDNSVQQILESLPPRTAVILTSGQGDHREVSRLQAKQKMFQELSKQKDVSEIPEEERFLEEDERKLEEAVEVAKSGICLLTIKK